jgi:hypothetical protein
VPEQYSALVSPDFSLDPLLCPVPGAKIDSAVTSARPYWVKGYGVGKHAKLLERILSGRSDANIRFSDLVRLLARLGFNERIRGDHHIFTRTNVEEILNLQPKGSMAKPYQVKQVRNMILKYKLGVDENE